MPAFGDAGLTFDPFVYLGLLAAKTERIALGVTSIILPLRHPVHVAKAAATADVLSGGRLLLGVRHLSAPLAVLEEIGGSHVALHLRFNRDNIESTMNRLADDVLPNFTH